MIGNLAVGIQDFVIPAPLGDFESIATVVVGGGGASSIDFTSISSDFQHLQVRGIMRSNVAPTGVDSGLLRFNSDTGNNYSWHRLYGNGSSANSDGAANTNLIPVSVQVRNGNVANTFGAFVIDILDYKDTNKYSTVRMLCGEDMNGSGDSWLISGSWRNTAAINRIDIAGGNSGAFQPYSHFALYGIKG